MEASIFFALELRGKFCNLLPNFLRIPKNVSPNWAVDQFSWADPVGTMDHIEAFLEFRNERMTKLLEKVTGSEETVHTSSLLVL